MPQIIPAHIRCTTPRTHPEQACVRINSFSGSQGEGLNRDLLPSSIQSAASFWEHYNYAKMQPRYLTHKLMCRAPPKNYVCGMMRRERPPNHHHSKKKCDIKNSLTANLTYITLLALCAPTSTRHGFFFCPTRSEVLAPYSSLIPQFPALIFRGCRT